MGKVADTLGSGLITGPATIVSGIMQSRSQNKATEAQERANQAALAFSREQEAAAQGRYGQSKAQYDQQVADWYAARNALLGRYGVDISLGKGGMPAMGAVPPAQAPGAAPRGAMARLPGKLQGATLGEIATSEPARDWADWSRYNLGEK